MGKCDTAVILCGGKSSRMGFDKGMLKINGKFLIEIIAEQFKEIFSEVILVTDDKSKFEGLGYNIVNDLEKGCGPAGGIYTGLIYSPSQYAFVTACDMPFINIGYIKYMLGIIDACSPDCIISKNGRFIEPLYAVYSRKLISTIKDSIKRGNKKMFEIIKDSNAYYVEDEVVCNFSREKEIFINLNYTQDIDILKRIYGKDINVSGDN